VAGYFNGPIRRLETKVNAEAPSTRVRFFQQFKKTNIFLMQINTFFFKVIFQGILLAITVKFFLLAGIHVFFRVTFQGGIGN